MKSHRGQGLTSVVAFTGCATVVYDVKAKLLEPRYDMSCMMTGNHHEPSNHSIPQQNRTMISCIHLVA